MKVNQTSNPRSYLFFSSLSYLGKTILKRMYRLPRSPFSLRMPSPITSFNVLGLDQFIFTWWSHRLIPSQCDDRVFSLLNFYCSMHPAMRYLLNKSNRFLFSCIKGVFIILFWRLSLKRFFRCFHVLILWILFMFSIRILALSTAIDFILLEKWFCHLNLKSLWTKTYSSTVGDSFGNSHV